MKKMIMQQILSLFVVILTLISFNANGQDKDGPEYGDTVFVKHRMDYPKDDKYTTDTILFPSEMRRHMLFGTTVLPNTFNQQCAKEYGLYLDKVIKTDCLIDSSERPDIKSKINSVIDTDTSLIVNVLINENCCYDFLCDISVNEKATLNLIHYGYGTWCGCDCCFRMTYFIKKVKGGEYGQKNVKAVVLNNYSKTLRVLK